MGALKTFDGLAPGNYDLRAVALGGAYTALAADANALHYNPAGLGLAAGGQATFMHNQYFEDISQEYFAYASPWGWGAALNYLDFGGAQRTTVSNPTGAGLGEVNLTSLAAGLGYGRELLPGFSAGAGLKYIKEDVAGETGTGYALDFGLLYSPAAVKGLSLGFAVQNMGSSVRFYEDTESLPLNLRAGAAYAFSVKGLPALVAVDAAKRLHEDAYACAGAEVVVAGRFPLRLGYSGLNDDGSGLTAGGGYRVRALSFDYAFVPYKELGAAHRFSVTYMWGKGE
ncbi:MAG: hypothetical protein A2X31_00515 [Elusimicrobia bacterium GWB2_63_22]|nr:MAG: hypothetical protein A2X31_00515 [Elusimicrobia bacterium GWB2_63_22]